MFKHMYCNATYIKSEVEIVSGRYSNGRLAIKLIDAYDGSTVAVATVNVPEFHLLKDEIIIKNWSENNGILEFLVKNGLVEDTGAVISTGHTVANIVKITDKLKSLIVD